MFRYIKQYAETITDANIYPIISLLIFFLFFVVLIVMVKRMKKDRITELSNIPFEKEELSNANS